MLPVADLWLFVQAAAALLLVGLRAENGEAPGACEAEPAAGAPRPRWRHRSYKPDQANSGIYGGAHIASTFGEHFDGPAVDDDWDVLWTYKAELGEVLARGLPTRPGRLINHCRYFRAAGQKCYFAGHMRRVERVLTSRGVTFKPLRSFVLNHGDQFQRWREEALADPDRPWVVKECSAGMSQGVQLLRGEALVRAANQGKPKVWSVAQEYLVRPYMGFGNRKFHLRVYVLVTRWGPPPSVLIFNEGVVFRSNTKYDPDRLSQARDIFSMLSPAIEALPHSSFWAALDEAAAAGRAAPAAEVRARMAALVGWIFGEALEESFGDAIKETRPAEVGFQCFDLFGLDVMFDEDLRPHVLEVNTGPNLNIDDRGEESTGLLHNVKGPLLKQVVHWAELYVRNAPGDGFNPMDIERIALVNFTRVL